MKFFKVLKGNTHMKNSTTLALNFIAATSLLLHLVAPVLRAAPPPIPNGPWIDAYNGKDFTGWSLEGNPQWSITNGVIQCKGQGIYDKSHMIWNEPMVDFELEATYKLSSDGANSGIQVRSNCLDKTKTPPTCGNTYQVCGPQLDVAKDYSGRLFGECNSFLQFDGQDIDDCRRTLHVGEWTTATSRIHGDSVSVWLNKVHCLDYKFTDPAFLSGTIFSIQTHPPHDLIEWQSIKIHKLGGPEVLGCTNSKASNYNPKATKDNGTCTVTSITNGMQVKMMPSITVSESKVNYSVMQPGKFSLRLIGADGIVLSQFEKIGPVMNSTLALPTHGIYFLELNVNGIRSQQKILNF